MDPDLQFAQATLNLLRHVAMSAPIPVIQALKEQLEKRYQQCVHPLHPGVDFLVQATLEGDFESVLPLVDGLLQAGAGPSISAIEQTLNTAVTQRASSMPGSPAASLPKSMHLTPGRGSGRAYREFFRQFPGSKQ